MREVIRQFVRICAEHLPIVDPIYEFGSLQVPGQEGFADLRVFFPNHREYVGTDIQEGPGVDLVLDLHEIDLPSNSVGTALMLDTLEHVEFPRRAVREVHRVLKPDGLLVMSSLMNFPIHDFPADYWRFTPEAFESLLRLFPRRFVEFAGWEDFPHTVVGVGFRGVIAQDVLETLRATCRDWKRRWKYPQKAAFTTFTQIVRPFVPPILRDAVDRMRGL